MGEVRVNGGVQPDEWWLCFHTTAAGPWTSFLAFGKFKHVSAFAYYPGHHKWLLYSVNLTGVHLALFDASDVHYLIAYSRDAVCVRFKLRAARWNGVLSRLAFYCVPAIKHLIGLRCVAFTPDQLYRAVMKHGGMLVEYGRSEST